MECDPQNIKICSQKFSIFVTSHRFLHFIFFLKIFSKFLLNFKILFKLDEICFKFLQILLKIFLKFFLKFPQILETKHPKFPTKFYENLSDIPKHILLRCTWSESVLGTWKYPKRVTRMECYQRNIHICFRKFSIFITFQRFLDKISFPYNFFKMS